MNFKQAISASLVLALAPIAANAETYVWTETGQGYLSDATSETVEVASTGTFNVDVKNTASITVSNGGTVSIESIDHIPAALNYTQDGKLYVADIQIFGATTNVLEIAEGKKVTITVGKFFDVVWPHEGDDWRKTISPLSTACVWKGGSRGNFGNSTGAYGSGTAAVWTKGSSGSSYASDTLTIKNALFTNEVAIVVNGQSMLVGACLLYDVALTMAKDKYLIMQGDMRGPGKLVFRREKIGTATTSAPVIVRNYGTPCNIYCPVEVARTSENGTANQNATVQFAPNNGGTFHLRGTVSGDGNVLAQEYNYTGGAVFVYGDMSGFTGLMQINLNMSSSSNCMFMVPNTVGGTVQIDDNNGKELCGSAGTYIFKSLSGEVKGGSSAVTIVTGEGDTEPKTIAYTKGTGAWTLEKRGSSQLTVTGADFSHYTLNGGTLVTVGSQAIGTDITTTASGSITGTTTQPWKYTFTPSADGVVIESESITVAQNWLEDHNLAGATADDLTAARPAGDESNGYSYLACYALGLDPSDPTSTPKVEASFGADGKFQLSLGGCGEIPDGIGISLSFLASDDNSSFSAEQGVSGNGESATLAIDPADVANVKFYKIRIDISGTAE